MSPISWQTVTDIIKDPDFSEINKEVELDEDESRRYIDIMVRGVEKGEKSNWVCSA